MSDMNPLATDDWTYNGVRTVILENRNLRVVVFPELGGKLYDLVYKPVQKNVLWHNPRIKPRRVPFGVPFDDVWCGGWDEIFPNDAPCVVGGEKYVDMGELWSVPWDYSITRKQNDSVTLTTSTSSPITPCRVSRSLTLVNDDSTIHLEYALRNVGNMPLKFLWKLHPAFDVNETCSIEIPGRTGIIDPRYRSLYSNSSRSYSWPIAIKNDGVKVDMSKVPPPTERTCTLHYVTELTEGWVKLCNRKDNVNVTMRFPKEIFSNIWLFLAYGGWRSVYTAVIEPSTSYPYDLAEAIKEGHCSLLEPGQTLECKIEVELSRNLRA
jgi:galactose mutarotase-like enzyme